MQRNITASTKRISVVLALVAACVVVESASGQTGDDALRFTQRIPGIDATSIGLAGTGVAGLGDASALILNPAGLAFARHSSISGSLSSFDITDDAVYRLGGMLSPSKSDLTTSGLGSLAAIYKVPTSRGSLALGIAFSQLGTYERSLFFEGDNDRNSITDYFMPLSDEFEIKSDGQDLFPDFSRIPSFIAYETFAIDFDQGLYDAGDPIPFLPAVSAGTLAQTGTVEEEGRLNELNFGAAFEAAEDIYVGASVNIPFSRYTFTRTFEEDDVFNDNDGNNGTTDFSYLGYTEFFQSDIVGVNARFGIAAQIDPQLRIGASIETPTLLSVEDEFDTVLSTEFDNGDAFAYGDDREEDAGSGFFDYEITTPWRLSGGASYRTGGLTIMADAEMIDWSQLEFDSKDSQFVFQEENSNIRQQFDAVVNARLGASYETGNFTIRGGFAVYPDPHDSAFTARTDEPVVDRDRRFVSLGLGYRFSNAMRLDLGWMQERFDDVYRPYTEVDQAPIVDEEIVRNRFQIGLTYNL